MKLNFLLFLFFLLVLTNVCADSDWVRQSTTGEQGPAGPSGLSDINDTHVQLQHLRLDGTLNLTTTQTDQFKLGYDANNFWNFTVTEVGNLWINPNVIPYAGPKLNPVLNLNYNNGTVCVNCNKSSNSYGLLIGGSEPDGTFGINGHILLTGGDDSNHFEVVDGNVLQNIAGGRTLVGISNSMGARLNVGSLTTSNIALAVTGIAGQLENIMEVSSLYTEEGDLFVVNATGSIGMNNKFPSPGTILHIIGNVTIQDGNLTVDYIVANGTMLTDVCHNNGSDCTFRIGDNVTLLAYILANNNTQNDYLINRISLNNVTLLTYLSDWNNSMAIFANETSSNNNRTLGIWSNETISFNNNSLAIWTNETILANNITVNEQLQMYIFNHSHNASNITAGTFPGLNYSFGGWVNARFNWTVYPDGWQTFDGSTLDFNESKLSTVYYNASDYTLVTGSLDAGYLNYTSHTDGNYDGLSMNFSESVGSPGFDLRFNFTGVPDFNNIIIRFESSIQSHSIKVQLYNFNEELWEDYRTLTTTEGFDTLEIGVFDSSEHLDSDNVAVLRFYHSSSGIITHEINFDWVSVSQGYGTPSGQEIDPLSIHRDGSIPLTADWDAVLNISMGYVKANGTLLTDVCHPNGSDCTFRANDNATLLAYILANNNTQNDYLINWISLNNVTLLSALTDWNNSMAIFANDTALLVSSNNNRSMGIFVNETISFNNHSVANWANETFTNMVSNNNRTLGIWTNETISFNNNSLAIWTNATLSEYIRLDNITQAVWGSEKFVNITGDNMTGDLALASTSAKFYMGAGAGPHEIIFGDNDGPPLMKIIYRSGDNQLLIEEALNNEDLFYLDYDNNLSWFVENVSIGESLKLNGFEGKEAGIINIKARAGTDEVMRIEEDTAGNTEFYDIGISSLGNLLFTDDDGVNRLRLYDGVELVAIGPDAPDTSMMLDVDGIVEIDFPTDADTLIGVCKSKADGTAADNELVECSNTPSDIAEYYPAEPDVVPGDIVCYSDTMHTYTEELFGQDGMPIYIEGARIVNDGNNYTQIDPRTEEEEFVEGDGNVRYNESDRLKTSRNIPYLKKADGSCKVVGVISTNPYMALAYGTVEGTSNPLPLAMAGRVPVQVNLENGIITKGDYITVSSTDGVGMNADDDDYVVGIALNNYNLLGTGTIMMTLHKDDAYLVNRINDLEARLLILETR